MLKSLIKKILEEVQTFKKNYWKKKITTIAVSQIKVKTRCYTNYWYLYLKIGIGFEVNPFIILKVLYPMAQPAHLGEASHSCQVSQDSSVLQDTQNY